MRACEEGQDAAPGSQVEGPPHPALKSLDEVIRRFSKQYQRVEMG
jgi:hypothetical protein